MSLEANLTAAFQQIGADSKLYARKLNPPTYYDVMSGGVYTFTEADSGTDFIWNSAASIILNVPDTLPEGWNCRISQFASGSMTLSGSSRTFFSNGSYPGLFMPGTSMRLGVKNALVGGVGGTVIPILYALADQPLWTQYVVNSAAQTRNATAMSSIPGVAVTLEINSIYDVDLEVSFSSAIASNTLKLGFAALPNGASVQMHGIVFNTNVSGTGPCTHKPLFTSADVVTGAVGSSAVVGATLLAKITGRITVGATSGVLQATAGSIATTGNVSIAAGAATMTVTKVKITG